jgi:CHAT domain-containing protein
MRAALAAGAAALLLTAGAVRAEDAARRAENADAALDAGRAALAGGRFEDAVSELERAASWYRTARRPHDELAALLALCQAQLAIGFLDGADVALRTLQPLAERDGTAAERAAVRAATGALALARDDLVEADRLLAEAAELARDAGAPVLAATAELNRGTLQALRGDLDGSVRALERAAEGAARAGDAALATRARANAARTLARAGAHERALAMAERVRRDATALEDRHVRATLLIHVGVTTRGLAEQAPALRPAADRESQQALASALEAARASGDTRSEAEALGQLGGLYESHGRREEALAMTREALITAAAHDAPESSYRWEWQNARLLAALGREPEAIAAYERSLRLFAAVPASALGARRTDASFSKAVDPLYRGLLDLILRRAARSADAGDAAVLRGRARELLETSRAAELRDYFRDDCVDAMRARAKRPDEISGSAVVIYPIVLDDRLELLVRRPGGSLEQFTVEVPRARLERELDDFRRLLLRRTTREYLRPARQLHAWLIAPWEHDIDREQIDTLVFVPDGPLRMVPMAALHDGERFLVERWAVAVTPGLELTDPGPLAPADRAVLLGGVSRAVDGFPALDHVRAELAALHETLGGQVLLDDAFEKQAVETALAGGRFGIVHVATHASFAAEVDESFLVTWDGRLSGDRLAAAIGELRLRSEPLELLTLSACETARGSERAALGLLGIAVQAGARSALGSLWKVNDDSTALLMRTFYEGLTEQGWSRGEALRRAQLALLGAPEWSHPLYWSGFVLINSWL